MSSSDCRHASSRIISLLLEARTPSCALLHNVGSQSTLIFALSFIILEARMPPCILLDDVGSQSTLIFALSFIILEVRTSFQVLLHNIGSQGNLRPPMFSAYSLNPRKISWIPPPLA